jgi:hypothetical protein
MSQGAHASKVAMRNSWCSLLSMVARDRPWYL